MADPKKVGEAVPKGPQNQEEHVEYWGPKGNVADYIQSLSFA